MAASATVVKTQYGGAYKRGVWVNVTDPDVPGPGYQKVTIPYDLAGDPEERLDYVRTQVPNPKDEQDLLGPQIDLRAGQIPVVGPPIDHLWEVEDDGAGGWNIVLYAFLAAQGATFTCFVEYGKAFSTEK